jgi:hypothetical protein
VRTDCKHSRITGKTESYPPRREKATSGKELILLGVWKGEFPTHNPTHSTRPLVRFSAAYAAFGSPRTLVSCCKTYNRAAVTAEAASSSLAVPAILFANVYAAFPITSEDQWHHKNQFRQRFANIAESLIRGVRSAKEMSAEIGIEVQSITTLNECDSKNAPYTTDGRVCFESFGRYVVSYC